MFETFGFYIRHSINDLRVNGQRTFFALLCIAAGVAAIVSLQTLGTMIENTLTGSLQESNRGDIRFEAGSSFVEASDALLRGVEEGVILENQVSFFGQTSTTYAVSIEGLAAIQAWADAAFPGQVALTYQVALTSPLSAFVGGTGAAITVPETGAQAGSLTAIMVETARYPFYGSVIARDGQPLADLIRQPTDIVLSEGVAEALNVTPGALVRISGSQADFTVRGIVDNDQQVKGLRDAFVTLFGGFYYLDVAAADLFDNPPRSADTVYVRLSDPARVVEVDNALRARFPYLDTETTEDLREQNAQLASNINQLVSVMGLVSLLIGSIGIINTMQVIVRRRTTEVAVLKTLGLQADQVTLLFLVEAVIMGVLGSLAGIVLGWLAVFVVRGAAEQLLARPLPFALVPGAALNGLIVGVLVTTVFGLLPTLAAGQVRPGVVLRPSDAVLPRAGWLRTFGALLIVVIALTLIAQTILGSFSTALAVIVGAFVAAGLLYLLLTLLIRAFVRFLPTFGNVDLTVALRQMNAGRRRAAITLLALVVGVFSLSLITLLAESVSNLLRYTLEEASGGNIAITAVSAQQLDQIEGLLAGAEGVNRTLRQQSYNLTLVSVTEPDGAVLTLDDLSARLATGVSFPFGGPPRGEDDAPRRRVNNLEILQATLGSVGARDLTMPETRPLVAGRALTAADAGQPVMVMTDNPWLTAAGIGVGDRLTFAFGGSLRPEQAADAEQITFEVVGILAQSLISGGFDSAQYAPADAFPAQRAPDANILIADVQPESIPTLRRDLAAARGAFVFETAVLTRLIEALLGTFTAFPTMVAALGLVVGGVVIANSVALTTLERRSEIAVMKAVGLQRERVLFMILLENGILGLIGGLIGVGIGLVGLMLSIAAFSAPGSAIPWGTALLLMLLCVLVALVAALTTAWGASGEKPLNVLRYE